MLLWREAHLHNHLLIAAQLLVHKKYLTRFRLSANIYQAQVIERLKVE